MKLRIDVKKPTMPNFILSSCGDFKVSVEELSEDEAKEYAELMKKEFLIHWKQKKNQNKSRKAFQRLV